MGDDDQDALIEALRPFVEQYGRDRIEQTLRQISPPARGRPKGTAPYLNSDKALMLAAYDEFLRMYARFHRDLAGRHPRPTTHGALTRVAKRTWPECRGGASTPEAVAKRLNNQFKREEKKAQPKRVSAK